MSKGLTGSGYTATPAATTTSSQVSLSPWTDFVRSYVIIFICFSHLFHLLLCALALFLFLRLAFICVLCSVAKLYLTLLNYYLFQSLSHVPLYEPLE